MSHAKSLLVSGLVASAALLASPAQAGVVATRAALDALLGSSAVTEDFNLLTNAPAGDQGSLNGVLDNSTNVPGLGTGRVVAGVAFSRVGQLNFPNDLYTPQAGYYGFANPALLSGSSQLQIDFTDATSAFGLDMLEYAGFADRVSIAIYAADDSTLLSNEEFFSINDPVNGVFFGYESVGGIGRVVLTGAQTWSPIIDNLTFGSQVPVPATLPLVALALSGLAATRRRA